MFRNSCFLLTLICLFGASGCARRLIRPTVPLGQTEELVVYLSDGGEVRGTLVERSPRAGVVLKLLDGSTRVIPTAAIEYAGRNGTGALDIDAAEPGTVSVDRLPVGHTPAHVDNLEPGEHSVEVQFDAGDSASTSAIVTAGHVATAALGGSKLRAVGEARQGSHLVVGGGVVFGSTNGEDGLGGVDLQAGMNYGIDPRLDFRLVGHLELGGGDYFFYEIAASAGFRLNLSSVFAMELGARLSLVPDHGYKSVSNGLYYNDVEVTTIMPALGAELSLLSLRLGSDRSYELTLWHALQIPLASSESYSDNASFRTGLSLVHVWN